MSVASSRDFREARPVVESKTEGLEGPLNPVSLHFLLTLSLATVVAPMAFGWHFSPPALSRRIAWTGRSGRRCSAARPAAMTWAGATPGR